MKRKSWKVKRLPAVKNISSTTIKYTLSLLIIHQALLKIRFSIRESSAEQGQACSTFVTPSGVQEFPNANLDLARPRMAGSKKTRSITMMTLFTIFELEQLSDNQLDHLHHILSQLLITTEPDSPDRRNILATLENVEIMLGQKHIRQIGYNRV